MIMNESLTDYSVFNNFAPSEDVLTFIHSLQENTIKGYLQTPVFGGGTCNTEYESLTGNSLTFLPGGVMPYQMYVTPDTGSARSNGGSGMQENIEQLLKKQRDFFNTGKTRDIRFRKAALLRLRQAIRRREQEISRALQADLGKAPFESYMTEVGLTLSELTYVLRHLDGWTREKKVPTPLAQFHGKSFTVPEPYGVVLVMAPWNYPFLLTMEPLIGALAAGNCCVLKPSEDAPRTSAVIASLLEEIYPKSYVTVVEGDRKISAALLEQRFDYIFFTGSVSVGKLVMEQAAKHLTPVTLELGGKSPCIVDETADLSLAARRIVFGKFLNSGQTCVAPDYVLVQRSVQEKFMQELCRQTKRQLGREPLANPHYPRMVNERHYDRVMHLLAGELAVIGGYGRRQTLQIAPTVLRDVSPEAPVMQEEIFGPVLPVLAFDRLEEALRFVKEREKPLALYLFTADRKTKAKILRQVPFGGGCVNDTVIHLATSAMGFGGVGNSGMGSYHGRDSFETFSHRKSIVDKSTWMDLPVRYQPYRWWKQALLRLFLR